MRTKNGSALLKQISKEMSATITKMNSVYKQFEKTKDLKVARKKIAEYEDLWQKHQNLQSEVNMMMRMEEFSSKLK